MQAANPWLWDHMAEYTRKMASIFHAFRIGTSGAAPAARATSQG